MIRRLRAFVQLILLRLFVRAPASPYEPLHDPAHPAEFPHPDEIPGTDDYEDEPGP